MKRKDFSNLKIEVKKEKDSYFKHENYIAGIPPFLRGISSTMYFQKPLEAEVLFEDTAIQYLAPEIELSTFLTSSFQFIQNRLKDNIAIDNLASKLYFKTTISEKYIDEIAKLRAIRMLWATLLKQFNPKNKNSLALNIKAIINNPTFTTAALFGGCQSIASKDSFHLFFEEEMGILNTIDPWAGSLIIEKRTIEIANKAWLIFEKENYS